MVIINGCCLPSTCTTATATKEANNRNAFDIALALYKSNMEKLVGLDMPYLKELQLQQLHDHLYIQAVQQFQEVCYAMLGDFTPGYQIYHFLFHRSRIWGRRS